MSQNTKKTNGSGDDTVAGEFVLGVLPAERRAEVSARMAADPGFAEKVGFWEEKLSPLVEDAEPVAAPSRVWSRIEAEIGAAPAKPQGLWNSIAFWRWLTGATSLAAAGALALLVTVGQPQPAPNLVAALQASGAGPSYLAQINATTGDLSISVVNAATDDTRVPELWLIPGDGVPRSLGVLTAQGAFSIDKKYRDLVIDGAALAISLEPEGGSPTGAPTGPVVATGTLQAL